jgi:hypothetical protein
MSDDNLRRIHDREVLERRKSWFYLAALGVAIALVVTAVGVSI